VSSNAWKSWHGEKCKQCIQLHNCVHGLNAESADNNHYFKEARTELNQMAQTRLVIEVKVKDKLFPVFN
jgi:hypothetical protein